MIKKQPSEIFEEYKKAYDYKASLGSRGIFDQAAMNERFYVGDQWHGVNAGNTRPLVRRNIIKRIGEYKISAISAAPVAVNYSADGIACTNDMDEAIKGISKDMMQSAPVGEVTPEEIDAVMDALTAYGKTTAERVKLNDLSAEMARTAYITGTAFLYTYWDGGVETGLFADKGRTVKIKGDIACQVLNVANVSLGDPNNNDIQSQPYIIISERLTVGDVKREAKRNRRSAADIDSISGDSESATYNAGDWGESEPQENERVTVLTKLWKEYDANGDTYAIKAIKVTEKAVIRPEWDLLIRLYPLAKFTWQNRFSSAYGDSEVTYLIPNQIAINRALSAAVWSAMITGMPKTVVNTDLVQDQITNDPGQIIKISAGADYDVQRAISYLRPPQFAGQMQNVVADIASNTLSDSGANDAALGDIRPDNASAIIAMREAALQPMQVYQNKFYSAIEDTARIWAEFWIQMYDNRPLKVENTNGTQYMPFNAERYKDLVINAKVDVGASTLWGESVVISTLGNLLQAGLITPIQYLQRLPKGVIPDITGLIEELKSRESAQAHEDEEIIAQLAQQNPELYEAYTQLPNSEKAKLLESVKAGAM